MTRPSMRMRPFSASSWAALRVFTIREYHKNLSSRRLSVTPLVRAGPLQVGERGKGGRSARFGCRPAPTAAAPDPAGLAVIGAEADVAHQPGHCLRLQAERGDQRLVDERSFLAGL